MKPDIKERWVAALRSGEYKQGKGTLKERGDCPPLYCCLGVLLEITFPGSVDVPRDDEQMTREELGHFDISVQDQDKLITMNDTGVTYEGDKIHPLSEPMSFPEIATWIEENL